MTTPPTSASAPAKPLPPAQDKTFTIEAQRRRKQCQKRLERFTQRGCARRGQLLGTQARLVPVTKYGVKTAVPGHRMLVVLANQAEQVLAKAAPVTQRRLMFRAG